MKTLFDKTELAGMQLKNRLFRSATWIGLCNPDGTFRNGLLDVYRELAEGGIGTIFTELTDVSPYNTAMGNNMRLYSDDLISEYIRLVDTAHEKDVCIIPQLNMDNYVRSTAPDQIIDIDDLTESDLADIRQLYTEAAVRAAKCGFDAIQLHLAYGWLLYRFLNPQCNHRTDSYGGSPENRARIVVEIIQAIKKRLPDMPVCAKFSFYPDYAALNLSQTLFRSASPIPREQGNIYAVDECAEICKHLYASGLDFIEVLGDHSMLERGNKYSSCYAPLAKAVREKCDIPVILTGTNSDVNAMEELLNADDIAYFALCRPLIREPGLVNRWLGGDTSNAKCIRCDQCYKTDGKRCIFNGGRRTV